MKNDNSSIQPQLRSTQRLLMAEAITLIILTAGVVAAYETEIAAPADAAGNGALQYYLLMAMELITICAIPTALKMFSMKAIRNRLAAHGSRALRGWGTLRIALIGLPMLLNTIMYYQFMAVAFAYMAIIGLLCMTFVYPSMGRCIDDIHPEE